MFRRHGMIGSGKFEKDDPTGLTDSITTKPALTPKNS